jgi:hypothetical protein
MDFVMRELEGAIWRAGAPGFESAVSAATG